jgi:two-component system, LytTR family, sensor histidine kinase AlgZ
MKWRSVALVFTVNTLGGISPALFAWLANPSADIGGLLYKSRFGMVYAWCIGTLSFFVMERIARWIRCRVPRLLQAPAFVSAFVALAVAGSVPASMLFVAFGWIAPSRMWPGFRQSVLIAIAFTVVIGSIVSAFEIVRHRLDAATIELRNRQLAEERARKLATEARLTSLESRVHPHFLFNTLNSISALIREDPRAAERTVERLAALLRESLDMDRNRLVPLHRELRIVDNYLEIERTRYGARLRYHIDVPPLLLELEVPPFCLQTLVENSVKHVVSERREGAEIRVTAHGESGRAILEVSDDGPGFEASSFTPGHGLDNLQDRLTALFEGGGRLQTERRNGRSVVSITIPMSTVAA